LTVAVLAHPGDHTARAVAGAVERRRGVGSAPVVSPDQLMLAPGWRHTLVEGVVATEVRCADGRRLGSGQLDGVFCRIATLPAPLFEAHPGADRDYALMEGYALVMSWLASLPCPVVNRAGSRGLSGPRMGFLEWLALGAASGLRPRGARLATAGGVAPGEGWTPHGFATGSATTLFLERCDDTAARGAAVWLAPLAASAIEVVVVGERVFGAPCAETAAAALGVARRSGCSLLALHVAPDARDGEPVLCGADPSPALAAEAVEAVADLLAGTA
jgi:hypothetical protein